ncbi:hypothetical protein TSST111916_05725 [Tsukamurella strandjordii]|uniref:ArsA family ATPase n=1 Tax=Tsukamurella TaxID=2060 RepID=UPI001C7D3073|nr:hypothetical protein [Tsukamurella sp. TY48]GIZ95683.1 membrane protein [Tsukamurella sp. TY48]
MSGDAARVLLVAGAGGTGRTTLATALAARAALSGRTLLVTLGRVVDPLVADGSGAFDHVHLNPVELLGQWWETLSSTVRAGRSGEDEAPSGFDPFVLEAPELTGLADAEHLLTLRAIRGHAQSGEYRTVVVDGPAFDAMVSLLTAPSSMAAHLERVWPRHVRLSGPTGRATGSLAGLLLVEPLAGLAEQLAAFVGDRSRLELVYALTGDGGRPARTRQEIAALEVLGLRPAALVLNRLLEVDDRFALDLPHPAVQLVAAAVASQDDAREAAADLGEAIARPVLEVTEAEGPVRDAADAAALDWDAARILSGPAGPPGPVPEVRRSGGEGLDVRYEWALEMPLVDPATIGLGRVEEDLLVDAQGVRRRMRLPSVLRRCVVAGATYTEGELRVTFAPDPEVWPRA